MRITRWCSIWATILLLVPGLSSAATFPSYQPQSPSEQEEVQQDAKRYEELKIFSEKEYASVYSALETTRKYGTLAGEDGKEYAMFGVWYLRMLNATSFVDSNGVTVHVDTVQKPDDDYDFYGTTSSDLDRRHALIMESLTWMDDASSSMRLYIRRMIRRFLAPTATTRDKLSALEVIYWTQRDTEPVRKLITPLLTDPNELVRDEAEATLFMLPDPENPADPFDTQD